MACLGVQAYVNNALLPPDVLMLPLPKGNFQHLLCLNEKAALAYIRASFMEACTSG